MKNVEIISLKIEKNDFFKRDSLEALAECQDARTIRFIYYLLEEMKKGASKKEECQESKK